MTDREAMKMALEALENADFIVDMADAHYGIEPEDRLQLIEALRQALAQPEQDDEAYGYAKYLAECIWKKHYKEESPHWRPSDNTLSVLTQIDNMTCGLEKAQPDNTSDSATRSADSAESFCNQELHNLMSVAGRMALELECLLLDTENLSVVSKWWDTGMEALQAYRHYVWSVTHGKDVENFCDTHCTWRDHHPDCELAQPEQEPIACVADLNEQVRSLFIEEGFSLHTALYAAPISEPVKGDISEPVENLEPVAWMHVQGRYEEPNLHELPDEFIERGWDQYPLYTAPPKREWVGLTDWERRHYNNRLSGSGVAEEIEAKLKERQL